MIGYYVLVSMYIDLGVSRSEFELALSQERDGWLTWNENDVSHPLMTILTSVTMMRWEDIPDSDQDDFRRRRAVEVYLVFSYIIINHT